MMHSIVGDIALGFCPCSTGMCPVIGHISTGDPMNMDHGMPSARTTDIVMFPCGPFTITGSCAADFTTGMSQSRPGDPCSGSGTGTLGSCATNTMSN